MSIEWLKAPVSDDNPVGEDLWENGDPQYEEYYFDSAGRLPEQFDFFKPGMEVGGKKQPDVLFDPKSVDLDGELKAIDGLLKKSRDIRLLILRAQWSILAGDFERCVESVEGMVYVLQAFPDTAYPQLNGGPADRLEPINDLSALGPMLLPLQYLDLAGSGTSLRQFRVAKGEVSPNDGEHDLILDQLIRALTSSGEELDVLVGRLKRYKGAIASIELACLENDTPHTPQLKRLTEQLDAIVAIVSEANPSLTQDDDSAEEGQEAAVGEIVQAGTGGAQVFVKPATDVVDHDDARRRLTAVETYFGQNEPSSATVLLVTQARLLIGKTLIDAFDVLMPNASPRAVVNFSPATDFKLAHGQLRTLADEVLIDESLLESAAAVQEEIVPPQGTEEHVESDESENQNNGPELESPPQVTTHIVTNPAEAASQIQSVEAYFRAVEKSSPVPLLLSRARSYIGKDFEALMKEFIPKEEY